MAGGGKFLVSSTCALGCVSEFLFGTSSSSTSVVLAGTLRTDAGLLVSGADKDEEATLGTSDVDDLKELEFEAVSCVE